MTSKKHLKRRVRERSTKTGESYATALRHLRANLMEEKQMSTVEHGATRILASCSFCKKNNTEVKKLIAGPGVYICDECVTLCDALVAVVTTPEEAARQGSDFVGRSAGELLELLPAMAETASEVEADVRRWVERVLAAGGTWNQVAESLGVDVESAQARFSIDTD